MRSLSFLLLLIALGAPALAEPYTVTDSRKNRVVFPNGTASFADEVVEYRPGSPGPRKAGKTPAAVLGVPDDPKKESSLVLGVGGSVTVRFTDNALVDVPGPDLYLFEVGPDVEATTVEISADGVTWIAAGRADGSLSQIDLQGCAVPGEVYRYVRLTDDPAQGGKSGRSPGADIDAVGAIGTAVLQQLSGEVLFDFDSDRLKPQADPLLVELAAAITARDPEWVVVEGHTDDRGGAEYNRSLSQRRAQAVADRLAALGIPAARVTVKGFGASRPVAPNTTEDGRSRNRRVEVVLGPAR